MSRHRQMVLFTVALLFSSELALADWRWTWWGMSVDELRQASPLELSPVREVVELEYLDNMMAYFAGDRIVEFEIESAKRPAQQWTARGAFVFRKTGQGLGSVQLRLEDLHCLYIKNDLDSWLGDPNYLADDPPSVRREDMMLWIDHWVTSDHNMYEFKYEGSTDWENGTWVIEIVAAEDPGI